jgi:L-aspartate oxidase
MKVAYECTTLVLGSGLAGLWYALKSVRDGDVLVLTKKRRAESNTNYAQGGVASVMAPTDSFELHVADTLRAGGGLCRRGAVEQMVREGPSLVRELCGQGASFSRDTTGSLDLGREGGHSQRRIIHAKDLTGREIERALLAAVENDPRIRILEDHFSLDLWVGVDSRSRRRRCYGATYIDPATGERRVVRARRTLLATGGSGKIYLYTTNPDIATGDGIAMAARAGCTIQNLEFFQFHPTCLYHPDKTSFLISEAVRGEGAVLRNLTGDDFLRDKHELGSLAPRDIVAREIDREMKSRGDKHVLLDTSPIGQERFAERFPNISRELLQLGIRPGRDPVPVVPAAHYMCGGVAVDLYGRTEVEALYAAGEVACTGVHGANRLASNSLLEATFVAERAATDAPPADTGDEPPLINGPGTGPRGEDEGVILDHDWDLVRRLLWDYVGLVRARSRLERAVARLKLVRQDTEQLYQATCPSPDLAELRNIALVGLILACSAKNRWESRGLHFLSDRPETDPIPRETWARLVGVEVNVELHELPPEERPAGTT